MGTKLHIGNLAPHTTEEQLLEAFSDYGKVLSAKVIMESSTGRSLGYAFVEMTSVNQAQQIIEDFDQKDWKGQVLRVSLAKNS